MSRQHKTFLKKTWIWLRTDQGLSVQEADLAMMLTVEEYDTLINMVDDND